VRRQKGATVRRLQIDTPEAMVARIDAWRAGLIVPASRAAAINVLLDRALNEVEVDQEALRQFVASLPRAEE